MSTKYEQLRGKDDSQETLLPQHSDQVTRSRWRKELLIIVSEATIIAVLVVVIVAQSISSAQKHHRGGFATDFGNLGDIIPFKQQAFINPLRPTSDFSALKMEWSDDQPRYTGPPNAEMDENWDQLLSSKKAASNELCVVSWLTKCLTPSVTTFNISGEAAKPAVGHTYEYSDGKYAMGLEVFHALHCIVSKPVSPLSILN